MVTCMFKGIVIALGTTTPENKMEYFDECGFDVELEKDLLRHKVRTFTMSEDEKSTLAEYAPAELIWITDRSLLAETLLRQGCCVIAFLHKEGNQESFRGVQYGILGFKDLSYDYFLKVYQRYRGLPWSITETERCIIRETTIEDVDAFYEIYSEPEITRYMENLFPQKEDEIAYTKDYIKNVYGFYGYGMWTILEKDTGQVIGRAGISHREGYDIPELGFIIGVPWQRKGYAYEVCRKILEYAEEELEMKQIQAFISPENQSSRRLCEKLGMKQMEEMDWKEFHWVRYLKENTEEEDV